ncbi:uncharacterized protein LOC100591493 [Nomascus leucogenys]|uniref:uncharacterized protein LOC100591493 n=1 Tax=Nomascus leucogenys TaxID=61853 RepID=UPI00020AE54E|nr:uncharacterized protein LOC100591493 [Nomascus leucogenys]
MTKRGQGIAQAVASEGASPKPWWLSYGVVPVGVPRTRIELWEPLPQFQRMYGNTWMSRQNSAAWEEPTWRTCTMARHRGNVGLESPHRVPTGALPSASVKRGPLSSRPLKCRSTDSLHRAPGNAGTQGQPMKAAAGAAPCKATGVELPKYLKDHPFLASSCIGYETWSQRRSFQSFNI